MNITYPVSFEYHEAFVANKMHDDANTIYNLVGRTCTPSDAIYAHKKLPPLEVEDLVALMDTGAYFIPTATNFGGPRPAIVLVDRDQVKLVRGRETYEHMVALDQWT